MSCLSDSMHDFALSFALSSGSEGVANRLLFNFVHFNFVHLAVNLYSFLFLTLLCNVKWWQFLASIAIAAVIPCHLLCETPIVGLSAIIYAATGMIIFSSSKFWYLLILNLLFISIGFFMPMVSGTTHLWCFALGLAIGLFFVFTYGAEGRNNQ